MEELYKYLELLKELKKIDDCPENQIRIDRVNDEIERLLGIQEQTMSDRAVASCDEIAAVTTTELFEQAKPPLQYAIIYQENRDWSELHWFLTKEKRDEVINSHFRRSTYLKHSSNAR